MKAIVISIKPNWVAKILNGEKTIEIRKTMPKCDLPVDVYIYCTLGELLQVHWKKANALEGKPPSYILYGRKVKKEDLSSPHTLNGKVIAKFTLNKVDEYINGINCERLEEGNYLDFEKDKVCQKSCVSEDELYAYCGDLHFFAWHIDNLEIFDEPKELSDFKPYTCNKCDFQLCSYCNIRPLTKAPQSWCYVEGGK